MIKETLLLVKDYLECSLDKECTVKLRPVPDQEEAQESNMLITITLLRIEEETSRKPAVTSRYISVMDDKGNPRRMVTNKKSPDVDINLEILISARAKEYETALGHISKVISAMNSIQTVPKPKGMKADFKALQSLNISILNLPLEQQFSMWQTLHRKLMPSVAYKLRMLTVPGEIEQDTAEIVKIVEVERGRMKDKDLGPHKLPPQIKQTDDLEDFMKEEEIKKNKH